MQSLRPSTLCLIPIAKHTLILAELEFIRVLSDSAHTHTHASHIKLQETFTLGHTHGLLMCLQTSFRGNLVHRPTNRGSRWRPGSTSGETLATVCPTGCVRAGTGHPRTASNSHLALGHVYPAIIL